MSVRVYVMAAGLGTRLQPLTGRTAKPMVPILNRPVMEHLLRLLRRHGLTEVAANLYYHPEKIRAHFGDGTAFGLELRYNLEERLMGTAGGAAAFRDWLAGDTFIVLSGDGLTDIDLTAFLAAHRANGGIATMAVKQVADPSLYGVVVHDVAGRVTGFQEKPPRTEALSDLCNCGIYAFEPDIFRYVPPGAFVDWAKDVFPALLRDHVAFHAWRLESYWNDVGNIQEYRRSNFDALLGRVQVEVPGEQIAPDVWVGEGSTVDPQAHLEPPVLIGAGCRVEAGARLKGPLIIGDGCVIERDAVLDSVIHWDGVRAGRGTHVEGSILGRQVVVHHGAVVHEDVVIGDHSEVTAEVLVSAGARVEPRTTVAEGPSAPDGAAPLDAG